MQKVTAAAIQATPAFLDRDATVERSEKLIHEAATNGAGLMVFPETFIPGYPDWVWRVPAWEGPSGELYERLLARQFGGGPGPRDRGARAGGEAGEGVRLDGRQRA